MDFPCKVESGLQLLGRLSERPSLARLLPALLRAGPSRGQTIELYDESMANAGGAVAALLCESLARTLLPHHLGGCGASAILLLTDGHFQIHGLIDAIRNITRLKSNIQKYNSTLDLIVETSLENLKILRVHDATEMYTAIRAFERLLWAHPDISLVAVDSLCAFYWADRMFGYGTLRMDAYARKVLNYLQTATKEYEPVLLYTKSSCFVSPTGQTEAFEICEKEHSLEKVNYRISLKHIAVMNSQKETCDAIQASVTSSEGTTLQIFVVVDGTPHWTVN